MSEFAKVDQLVQARKVFEKRKRILLANEIQWLNWDAGRAVQMLRVVPFDTEPVTLFKIQYLILSNSLQRNGPQNEIYI